VSPPVLVREVVDDLRDGARTDPVLLALTPALVALALGRIPAA